MPLEPTDLATLDAYAEKCKKDVALISASDDKPFWIYKDFPIQDKGKPVQNHLVSPNQQKQSRRAAQGHIGGQRHLSFAGGEDSLFAG
jgi:hypothetical protein